MIFLHGWLSFGFYNLLQILDILLSILKKNNLNNICEQNAKIIFVI